jgi:DNA-binding CsgD family transcriptional regulator
MNGLQTREGLYGFEYLKPDKRRAPEGERKTYEIKGLWQRNHEIVNLAVKGFKNVEIAEILNIDPQTVSNTLNSELGKRKLSEMRLEEDIETKKISEKIRTLTNKALNVYHEIFDDESGECSLKDKKAAADVVALEIGGLRAPTRIHSSHVSTTLTKEELESFKIRGAKAIKESGVVINVEEVKK